MVGWLIYLFLTGVIAPTGRMLTILPVKPERFGSQLLTGEKLLRSRNHKISRAPWRDASWMMTRTPLALTKLLVQDVMSTWQYMINVEGND